ncbi:hypothetical protein CEV33_2977 [Brucella grignonensis]|uniref:Uncharacterized protein n=1 Tax=Brucella grignonensis TaxID=94627 RepID=A0A256F307_9HYPH|nr:hypothetical protein CEV33_2977 [Brucella grignonensis]
MQLSFDLDHWAASNPAEQPIMAEPDFTLDVEWRKASHEEDGAAA